MSYLIDTNVISELVRPKPDTGVVKFMRDLSVGYLSVITIHELSYGVHLRPAGEKKSKLVSAVEALTEQFHHFIIPVEEGDAALAGYLRAQAQSGGRTIHMPDALLAATAKRHDLTLATRNIRDFEGMDVTLLNPFSQTRNTESSR